LLSSTYVPSSIVPPWGCGGSEDRHVDAIVGPNASMVLQVPASFSEAGHAMSDDASIDDEESSRPVVEESAAPDNSASAGASPNVEEPPSAIAASSRAPGVD
jgi:hypothetical protein